MNFREICQENNKKDCLIHFSKLSLKTEIDRIKLLKKKHHTLTVKVEKLKLGIDYLIDLKANKLLNRICRIKNEILKSEIFVETCKKDIAELEHEIENNLNMIEQDLKDLNLIKENLDRSNPPTTTMEQEADIIRKIYKRLRKQMIAFSEQGL